MAKSKFSKKQIAGTLLLSSAAISAVASGTASANKFKDFLGNGLRKTGELVKNIMFGGEISNKLDGHEQIVGTVTWGVVCLLAYGTYKAIKAGFNYYHSANKKNNREKRDKFFKDQKKNNNNKLGDMEKLDKKIDLVDNSIKINQGSSKIENNAESNSISIQKSNTDQTIKENENDNEKKNEGGKSDKKDSNEKLNNKNNDE